METRRGVAVAIISKLPRLGATKTRLARTLGPEAALALHRAFLADEIAELDAPERWMLHLVHDAPRTAEDEAERDALCGGRARSLVPGAQALPAELLAAFERLLDHHERAVIVSGDVPQLDRETVAAAVRALDHADVVFGPGPDGGYFLVGLRRPHDLFTPITMGRGPVLAATIAMARERGLSVEVLPPLADMDEAQDLLALEHADARLAPRTRAVVAGLVRGPVALGLPSELQIEVTNRCNLACTVCLRTHQSLEPEATLSFADYARIIEGLPNLARIAFQLNGESLLAPDLPAMIADAARRGIHTVLNTNGTLLDAPRRAALLASGLHELRVSVLGGTRQTVASLSGADILPRVKSNLANLVRERDSLTRPHVSLWMVATRRTVPELIQLIELAGQVGVTEVYVQRLVLTGLGAATRADSVHGQLYDFEQELLDAEATARRLGVAIRASGRMPVRESLTQVSSPQPRAGCFRPWRSAVVTAGKRVLPCCIASFTAPYSEIELGDLRADSWEVLWNGARYQALRRALLEGPPWPACAECGERWSL